MKSLSDEDLAQVKSAIIDGIDELVSELVAFEDTNDIKVEVVVGTDGSILLMQLSDDGSGSEELERFASVKELVTHVCGK